MTEREKLSEPEKNKIKNTFHTLIDSAVIIALATALLYIVSFFYLKGFYSYYALVDIEIDFSIFKILKTSLEIFKSLFLLLIIYSLQAVNTSRMHKNPTLNVFFTSLWILLLVQLFIKLAIYSDKRFYHISYIILAFTLLGLFFIVNILLNFLPESKKEKISNFLNKGDKFSLSFLYKIILYLGLIYLIINFIPEYGYNEARTKKDYLYDAQNQRVLIYQDNEKSIFLPKTENDTFVRQYIIISTSELSNIILEHYEHEISFTAENDISNEEFELEETVISGD